MAMTWLQTKLSVLSASCASKHHLPDPPTTFPHFLSLPENIRRQIWTLATLPHGPITLNTTTLLSLSVAYGPAPEAQLKCFLQRLSPNDLRHNISSSVSERFVKEKKEIAEARNRLMAVCRESRNVVVGVWMDMLHGLPLSPDDGTDDAITRLSSILLFPSPSPAETGRTFPKFTHLPIELQLAIWKLATFPDGGIQLQTLILLPSPPPSAYWVYEAPRISCARRLLRFWHRTGPKAIHDYLANSGRKGIYTKRAFTCSSARPALLGTCKLSRRTAIEGWIGVVRDIEMTPAYEAGFDKTNILLRLSALMETPFVPPASKPTSRSFHHFPRLPLHIQQRIWTMAAMPKGEFTVNSRLLTQLDCPRDIGDRRVLRLARYLQPGKMYRWTCVRDAGDGVVRLDGEALGRALAAGRAREGLMGACRLSRWVVAERWAGVLGRSCPEIGGVEMRDGVVRRPSAFLGREGVVEGLRRVGERCMRE